MRSLTRYLFVQDLNNGEYAVVEKKTAVPVLDFLSYFDVLELRDQICAFIGPPSAEQAIALTLKYEQSLQVDRGN